MKTTPPVLILLLAWACAVPAEAKLPAPSEQAKAQAAEAAARAAHGNKLADYQLCRSRERAAAHYYKSAKAAGKETRPPLPTPPCADPGPYVATPAAAPAPSTAPARKS